MEKDNLEELLNKQWPPGEYYCAHCVPPQRVLVVGHKRFEPTNNFAAVLAWPHLHSFSGLSEHGTSYRFSYCDLATPAEIAWRALKSYHV